MLSFLNNEKIKSNDLDNLLPEIKLIDVREPSEYSVSSINGSKNIPMGRLLQSPADYLRKEEVYHILCQSGMRSSIATSMLKAKGFKAINVSGGMNSYTGIHRNK